MEAPKKIYLSDFTDTTEAVFYIKKDNTKKTDIEYTRTDAFIEKAVEWLEDHKWAVETEDHGIMGWIPDYFIEDFKNYMKGE